MPAAGAAKAKVTKWGNSTGIRLTKDVLEEAHFAEGDELEIEVERPGVIRVRAAEEAVTLKDLVSRVTPENRHALVDWGRPSGKEIW